MRGRWIESSLFLSFIAWLTTTILWAVFTAMKTPAADISTLSQVWLLVSGVFIANLQIAKQQLSDRKKEKESQNDGDS